jgi:hypothetical protein
MSCDWEGILMDRTWTRRTRSLAWWRWLTKTAASPLVGGATMGKSPVASRYAKGCMTGRLSTAVAITVAMLAGLAATIVASGAPMAVAATHPTVPRAITTTSCTGPGDFGTQYLSSAWPGGFTGVPVYSNGSASYVSNCYNYATTPSGTSVKSGMEWQCVELINRLYISRGWINATWTGDGDQLYSTAASVGLTNEQRQGSITYLAPGDVISFNGPISGGHAAVVSEVSGSSITLVNQNTSSSNKISTGTLSNGSLAMNGWAGYTPIGVIHAPQSGGSGPTITTTSLPSGVLGQLYTASLSASGGTGGYNWTLLSGSLPGGLALSSSGVVSGHPFAVGTTSITVKVTDSSGSSSSAVVSLSIAPISYYYVYYVGSDGAIHVLLWNGSEWQNQTLGGSPLKKTAVSAFAGTNGYFYVYYVGSNHAIELLMWNGSEWVKQDLGGAATGSGVSAFAGTNGYYYVYYVGSDGAIHVLLWNGSEWQNQTLGGNASATGGISAF